MPPATKTMRQVRRPATPAAPGLAAIAGAVVALALACGGDDAPATDATPPDGAGDVTPTGSCDDHQPLRNVYFGDLHVHTARSLDASLQGTRLGPFDAYRFARGEEVGIQPHDPSGAPLRSLRLERPLDFAAVTDHAEFLGAVSVCATPGQPGYDHPECERIRDDPDAAFMSVNGYLAFDESSARPPPLCGEAGADCVEPTRGVWAEMQDAAEAYYDRSAACAFTTFVAYEWSANPGTSNLHRNVIFASERVPDWPIGYFDEPHAEGLRAALRRDCLDAGTGCDVIVIPHNSNLSTGRMFDGLDRHGQPIDAAFAAEQAALEPLVEIMQHKGDSECAIGGPTSDELCGFEKLPYDTLAGAALDFPGAPLPRDHVRDALGLGLAFLERLGVNPYAFGFIASTDTHIGTPGLVEERGFPGHGGAGDAHRDALPPGLPDSIAFNPGGLAAVWAEENRRPAIFAALRRKETYGTSGPRIVLRFFGGWGYEAGLCAAADLTARGYAEGVPMGGELRPRPEGAGAPRFVLWALRDPGTAATPGTPLQRAQVIKGWREGGAFQVRVFDVAGDADSDAGVDLVTCEPHGDGADELCAIWTDPDFDPSRPAYYYARVVENPTCRWSTHQCAAAGVDCERPETVSEGFEGCCDPRFERVIQERAWSSPIWYVP